MDTPLAAYLPQDRCQALARGEDLPERTSGAALFADIAGFTALTEALDRALGARCGAEELTRQLNQVYTTLIAEVERPGGSVIDFAGDSIMCWFDDAGDGGWGLVIAPQPPSPILGKGGCLRPGAPAGHAPICRHYTAGRHDPPA